MSAKYQDICEEIGEADPVKRTCYEIILCAIKDWRYLVEREVRGRKSKKDCNFSELRQFFKSDWCEFLLQDLNIKPTEILQKLEAELLAARKEAEKNGAGKNNCSCRKKCK